MESNTNSQNEDEKVEKGVRAHNKFLRMCVSVCVQTYAWDHLLLIDALHEKHSKI